MKVSNVQSPKTAAVDKKRKSAPAAGPSFRSHLDQATGGVDEVASPAGGSTVSPVQSILAAQEAGDHEESLGRRQLIQRGADILDRLDEIRHELLTGAVSRSRLENLSQMLRVRKAATSDPKLRELIKEIELRAEVEIAKLTREI